MPDKKETKNIEDLVYMTKEEYEDLQKSARILEALQAAGVDNWDGYDEAMNSLE